MFFIVVLIVLLILFVSFQPNKNFKTTSYAAKQNCTAITYPFVKRLDSARSIANVQLNEMLDKAQENEPFILATSSFSDLKLTYLLTDYIFKTQDKVYPIYTFTIYIPENAPDYTSSFQFKQEVKSHSLYGQIRLNDVKDGNILVIADHNLQQESYQNEKRLQYNFKRNSYVPFYIFNNPGQYVIKLGSLITTFPDYDYKPNVNFNEQLSFEFEFKANGSVLDVFRRLQ